jgi:hypothetical protein
MHPKFLSENPKGRNHSEDIGVDDRINTGMYPKEVEWEGVNWIHLAQDWNQWQALMNTIMNLQVL